MWKCTSACLAWRAMLENAGLYGVASPENLDINASTARTRTTNSGTSKGADASFLIPANLSLLFVEPFVMPKVASMSHVANTTNERAECENAEEPAKVCSDWPYPTADR